VRTGLGWAWCGRRGRAAGVLRSDLSGWDAGVSGFTALVEAPRCARLLRSSGLSRSQGRRGDGWRRGQPQRLSTGRRRARGEATVTDLIAPLAISMYANCGDGCGDGAVRVYWAGLVEDNERDDVSPCVIAEMP
jgi:hypothetical protein